MRSETPLVEWNHHKTSISQEGASQISWLLYQNLYVQGAFQGTSTGSEKILKGTKSIGVHSVADSSRSAITITFLRTIHAALFVGGQPFSTTTTSTTQSSDASPASIRSVSPSSLKSNRLRQPRFSGSLISSVCVIPYIWS